MTVALLSRGDACERADPVRGPARFGIRVDAFGAPIYAFLHSVLLLCCRLVMVPEPGLGPGRLPRKPHAPKACASSDSATRARLLDVGTVPLHRDCPVPTFFGPSSAALKPSSCRTSTKLLRDSGEQACGAKNSGKGFF